MNIVDLIKNQVTGSVTEKVAGMIGISPDQAKSATGAAIPSLLAGLAGLGSTPEGSRKLDAAVDQADTSFGDNPLAGIAKLGAGGAEGGASLLTSLLGGSTLSGLSGALGRFTGLGGSSITGLLSMLAPMVLGLLKGQKQSLGLGAGGLSSLLASQKNNILGAMPAGLSGALGSIPGLSSFTGAASQTAAKVADAGSEAWDRTRETAGQTFEDARDAVPSAAKWAVPLAVVLALGALALWLANRPAEKPMSYTATPQQQPAVQQPVAGAVESAKTDLGNAAETAKATLDVPATTVSTQFTDFLKSSTETLGQIKDTASAEAAIPALKELPDKLSAIQSGFTALPASSKTSVLNGVQPWIQKLNDGIDKASAIPGVGDKIKPYVTQIKDKIAAMIAG